MNSLFYFFYDTGIQLYYAAILIASAWDEKAKQWLTGRKDQFRKIESSLQPNEYRVWFHCASAGEFEQGRPVIEAYRREWPGHKIVLTFFSPSGFKLRKNYTGADYIFYLPLDTKKNAEKFISLVGPRIAFFVKYEFWHRHLSALKKKNIPTLLISGIFRDEQVFFKWYGKPFRKSLGCFKQFFLQDEHSLHLLKSIGINDAAVAGDTRFDRVSEIAEHPKNLPLISAFKGENKLFVAGSTWPEDEKIISDLISITTESWKWIIVPHEIKNSHLNYLRNKWKEKAMLYSEATNEDLLNKTVLIIDEVGLLSSIYYYANTAFIGGGFGKGIHNILEAAVYGIPLIFGPNYQKFAEATELISLRAARSVSSSDELISAFNNFSRADRTFSEINRSYVINKKGATQHIMNYLRQVNANIVASPA